MKVLTTILLFLTSNLLFAQTEQRIQIISVTPSVNTGQDYSSWLTDDLNNLVPNVWSAANFSWVDVTLKLEKQTAISRLSFYDYEGVFTDNPAAIYALKGTEKTFLGYFTGDTYRTFVNIKLSNPIVADAIIIHKYCNNIPEKVQVYGQFTNAATSIAEERLKVVSVTAAGNTGMNFSSWLNDNLNDLVQNVWTTANLKYADVVLKLENRSTVSRLSFYDYEGVFTTNPAYVYALNGDVRTYLGVFTGETYQNFVSLKLSKAVTADAIIIQKYSNNIPQKVQVYGTIDRAQAVIASKIQSVISFANLTDKIAEGPAYDLLATSNNNSVPIIFSSSNPAVIAVSNASGSWKATPLNAGIATITASQAGSTTYSAAIDVAKTQVVNKIQSVISFADLVSKTAGDAAYALTATSNNSTTPVTFTSSNPAVVSVSNASGNWKATPLSVGTAVITASQTGNNNYSAAIDVTKQQIVSLKNQLRLVSDQNKLPMVGKYWYQLNNTGDNTTDKTGLQQLTDGNITDQVFMGWGKILPNYDCYYDFKNLANVTISKIRFFDGQGIFADKPFKLYAKATVTSAPVLIATFTGEAYNQWVEVNLPVPVKAKYLIANVWYGFPVEIELYGTYQTAPAVSLFPQKEIKFAAMDGVNSFVWDFLQSWENANIRDKIYGPSMKLMNAFTQYRDYVDWEKIEPSQGNYTFNPTQNGGWNYDVMYKQLKDAGKDVIACLKTVPDWFLQKYYPSDQRDSENVPAPYGSDLLNPNSYILQSKMAFQFAARYGSNKNILSNLLNNVVTGLIYLTAPEAGSRTKETGLGYIKYIECENERDKWWKGRKAYQTAREYAANLSAFYDGHKNTMGAGVGVKNADPNMKVVIGGIASNVDYIKGIIDWCKEFRGYKADGSVNLCFDVINYHYYSGDSGASQNGISTSGAAPELSGSADNATAFTELGREYNAEVWITETGYDVNQHSPLHAPIIGNKTAEEVQADWILRSGLLYAQNGVNRVFFYQSYDENADSWIQFGSSGLLNPTTRKRKPAADYLFQTNNLIGNYIYKETISDNPAIHRYQLQDTAVYVAYLPTAQGKTLNYTLNLGSASKAKIYTLKSGQDNMVVKEVSLANNSLNTTLTETPVFVKVISPDNSQFKIFNTNFAESETASSNLINPVDSASDKTLKPFTSLILYPNPTGDFVSVSFDNDKTGPVEMKIFNASTGITVKQVSSAKAGTSFTQKIDVSALPVGIYILEVKQGSLKTQKKLIRKQ